MIGHAYQPPVIQPRAPHRTGLFGREPGIQRIRLVGHDSVGQDSAFGCADREGFYRLVHAAAPVVRPSAAVLATIPPDLRAEQRLAASPGLSGPVAFTAKTSRIGL